MGRRRGAPTNINPSNTNDVVGDYARGTRRPMPSARSRRPRRRFPAWSRSDIQERHDILKQGLRRDPGAQGRARRAAVARGGQDARRRASARSSAPAQIFDFFAGEALRLSGERCPRASRHRRRDHARAGRRRRHHHAVEFPDRHPGLEDRAGARLRQHRRVQAGRPRAGLAWAIVDILAPRRPARRACSTSSWAGARWSARRSLDSPDINAITFTGSVGTGGAVAEAASVKQMRKFQLEMGGKNPLVVLDDADLEGRGRVRRQRRVLLDRPALHGLVAPHRRPRASTTSSSTR